MGYVPAVKVAHIKEKANIVDSSEAAKHLEPGWEQPGKQRTRTGSSGSGAALELIIRERPRHREEEAVAAAGTDNECMNKSQERWGERTRKTRDGNREEKERQAHGIRTGTSGEAMNPDWNIRGAEALDLNVWGRSGPVLERPGPQKEEEMAAERSGEEHMNMSMDQMGKDTTDEGREVGGEGAKEKEANHVEPGRGQPAKQRSAEVAAAVQRMLDSAQEGQEWPEEMPERARRQVIPGDGKCLYWGLSAVDGAGGQAAAEEVRRALTEGDMARLPESGWARSVMRDAGARTWDQYLDKVRRGEIWGGACEVGSRGQSKGCRVAMYQEWGLRGVYRKMAGSGEGKRTAAALLWTRQGGGHYELLWPLEEGEAEAVAEAEEEDGTESKGEAEVTTEEELAEERPEKGGGKRADRGASVAGSASNTDRREG